MLSNKLKKDNDLSSKFNGIENSQSKVMKKLTKKNYQIPLWTGKISSIGDLLVFRNSIMTFRKVSKIFSLQSSRERKVVSISSNFSLEHFFKSRTYSFIQENILCMRDEESWNNGKFIYLVFPDNLMILWKKGFSKIFAISSISKNNATSDFISLFFILNCY